MEIKVTNRIPEFVQGADNVYRTKGYIVKQTIEIRYDCEEDNAVVSRDTFYKRSPVRDREYEIIFCTRRNINGKRLPTTMYTRKYVE